MGQADEADVVVVGGGPGGLSAATWAARYRHTVVVVDSGVYRNALVEESHGYHGNDALPPATLRAAAREQLLAYPGTAIRAAHVERIDGTADSFELATSDGAIRARRLVLATGVTDVVPDVADFLEHYGADVYHCPACDGYEMRDRDVVVFGWSSHVVGFALGLLEWARSVTIVTDDHRFRGDHDDLERLERNGVAVSEGDAVELVGPRGGLRAVKLRDGRELPCQAAFFSIKHRPNNQLARALHCGITMEGCVVVDEHGKTTIDGVYAAGDLVPGMQLIQVAAASGVVAGVAVARSLAKQR